MKVFRVLFCLLFVTTAFISCDDSGKDVRTQGITSSGCKRHLTRSEVEESEYLTYEVKDGTLIISLFNYPVPCDMTKMGAQITNENNQIVLIPEELDGGLANCNCPTDFTFPIQDLVHGTVYQCIVKCKRSMRDYSFSFTFKEGEKGEIIPEENQ